MNTENSKTNKRHKFVLKFSQRFDLKVQINMSLFKIQERSIKKINSK